jgi:hypothetical protein
MLVDAGDGTGNAIPCSPLTPCVIPVIILAIELPDVALFNNCVF